ncbi:hypothetical protein MTO96_050249 [Rhipicephalus appendiculatus]
MEVTVTVEGHTISTEEFNADHWTPVLYKVYASRPASSPKPLSYPNATFEAANPNAGNTVRAAAAATGSGKTPPHLPPATKETHSRRCTTQQAAATAPTERYSRCRSSARAHPAQATEASLDQAWTKLLNQNWGPPRSSSKQASSLTAPSTLQDALAKSREEAAAAKAEAQAARAEAAALRKHIAKLEAQISALATSHAIQPIPRSYCIPTHRFYHPLSYPATSILLPLLIR